MATIGKISSQYRGSPLAIGDGGASAFYVYVSLIIYCCVSITLVLRGRSPSTATEPLPREWGVRGWRMARPVYVAGNAS